MLADKEFSLIQALALNPAQSQRELSQNAGLSLGMTNILLKRMIRKGFVKATHLDWKRTQYLLTVKGLMEKARKSCAWAVHAYRQFRLIRRAIAEVVLREHQAGLRSAVVVAWPETAAMIRECLRELDLPGLSVRYVEEYGRLNGRGGVVFTATVEPPPEPVPGRRLIPLLDSEALCFRFEEPGGPS